MNSQQTYLSLSPVKTVNKCTSYVINGMAGILLLYLDRNCGYVRKKFPSVSSLGHLSVKALQARVPKSEEYIAKLREPET